MGLYFWDHKPGLIFVPLRVLRMGPICLVSHSLREVRHVRQHWPRKARRRYERAIEGLNR